MQDTNGLNSDGDNPYASLLLTNNMLYGTTVYGGTLGYGTIFRINVDGSGFTNLYNFTGATSGGSPMGSLISSGNTLYGTTTSGGSGGNGTVFKFNIQGATLTILYSFSMQTNGWSPEGGLLLSGDILYGTTSDSGSVGGGHSGTIFSIGTDGAGFTNIYIFPPTDGGYVNNDGAFPVASLIISGNTLYGTTTFGGSNSDGTLFSVNTDGSDFKLLFPFTGSSGSMILSGNNLYGTFSSGGIEQGGSVFSLNTNGIGGQLDGLADLYYFSSASTNGIGAYTNSDGLIPQAALVVSNGNMYGTTTSGGLNGFGTVFSMDTNGTHFVNLYSFTNGYISFNSVSALVMSGNTLYGTAAYGGTNVYKGMIYSISLNLSWAGSGCTYLGSGWWRSPWLGTFNVSSYPWIYHVQHGWLYVDGTDPDIWFYNSTGNMGWLWTSSTTYPWLWSDQQQSWLYYDVGSKSPRYFFNRVNQAWEAQNP